MKQVTKRDIYDLLKQSISELEVSVNELKVKVDAKTKN